MPSRIRFAFQQSEGSVMRFGSDASRRLVMWSWENLSKAEVDRICPRGMNSSPKELLALAARIHQLPRINMNFPYIAVWRVRRGRKGREYLRLCKEWRHARARRPRPVEIEYEEAPQRLRVAAPRERVNWRIRDIAPGIGIRRVVEEPQRPRVGIWRDR